jgi:hypothetical protein
VTTTNAVPIFAVWEWVSLFSGGDSEWAAAVKRELGLDLAL